MSGYGNPLAALAGGLVNSLAPTIMQSVEARHRQEAEHEALKLKTLEMLGQNVDLSDPGSMTAYTTMLNEYINSMGKGKKGGKKQNDILGQFGSSLFAGGETGGKPAEPAKVATGSGGAAGIPAVNYTAGKAAVPGTPIPTPPGKMRMINEGERDLRRAKPTLDYQAKLKEQDEIRKNNEKRVEFDRKDKADKEKLNIRYDLMLRNAGVKEVQAAKDKIMLDTEKNAAALAAANGKNYAMLPEEDKGFFRQLAGEEIQQKIGDNLRKIEASTDYIRRNTQHLDKVDMGIDATIAEKKAKVENAPAVAKLGEIKTNLKTLREALEAEQRKLNDYKQDVTERHETEPIEANIARIERDIATKENEANQVIASFNNTAAPVHKTPVAPVKIGSNNGAHTQPGKKVFPASKLQDYAKAHTNGDVNAARKELTHGGYNIEEGK